MGGGAESAASGGGFWTGTGGALASAGLGLMAAPVNYGFSAMAASKSWDRQKNLMTRGPTYMMQGYRDAKLNPLLAITGGKAFGGGAKAPQANPPGAQVGNPATLAAIKNLNAQSAKYASEAALADARTGLVTQEEALALSRTKYQDLDNRQKTVLVKYFESPAGQDAVRREIESRALPQSWAGLIAQGLSGALDETAARRINELAEMFPEGTLVGNLARLALDIAKRQIYKPATKAQPSYKPGPQSVDPLISIERNYSTDYPLEY